ncbi:MULTISPECIES: WXG100 family type VII secretion target [Mycobacteriaceae]|uniref:WXG100 family type VII secretion target n=1 Tax=Mycobacteriaceae TaxID=1762 RepID=UPI0010F0AC0F|nr:MULTISPECIES: WXG100 family type VII secretion target [Mycobacteriaceae]TDO10464.1 type VII secretion system (Wss) protein ESAT-6 [Mycobacterium sp. BK086]
MARMGMDVEQVEQSGRQLKSHAASIGNLVSQLDKLVQGLTGIWDGPDAQRFVNEWWPQHRRSLTAAQQEIDGLGQSALNNASEQRNVSQR